MRLINTRTLQLEDFFDDAIPEYAILSHTWEKQEAKIQGACDLAAGQGYGHVWIDTCCIDKSSSAELSEAINSMYRWYSLSAALLRLPLRVPALLSDQSVQSDPPDLN